MRFVEMWVRMTLPVFVGVLQGCFVVPDVGLRSFKMDEKTRVIFFKTGRKFTNFI